MPKKYHVNIKSIPPRFEPIPEFCTIEIKPCLKCNCCVKFSACIYNIYRKRGFDHVQVLDTGDSRCEGCMRCVQECKANIITRVRNSRFDALGDDYWRPDLIHRIWRQAETGKIPVSGTGYRGPFCGPGFDQMWTDMSEIVRPTRDGIHGREYISTMIELGRRPERLRFDENGNLLTDAPAIMELPIPVILDLSPIKFMSESTRKAIVKAAIDLETIAVADYEEAKGFLAEYRKHLIVKFDPESQSLADIEGVPILELSYSDLIMNTISKIKEQRPDIITSIRLPLDENSVERVSKLGRAGAEIIHLQASPKGRGLGKCNDEFITGLVRRVHLQLIDDSIREQVTLLISGGIAMAEHVAKIIICGVDGVGIDLAILVALECRLCKNCQDSIECPVHLDKIPVDYGAQRIVNLIGSWHSQLIEVLGAMGLREIRRLRGEVGRTMFFNDLEKENFAPIFENRKPLSASSLQTGQGIALKKSLVETPVASLKSWTFPLVDGLVKVCGSRYRNRL